MNGIVSVLRGDGSPVKLTDLTAMAAALENGCGTEGWAFSIPHVGCGIGAHPPRFTQEDLFERQPVASGEISLVADARLDNRDQLARQLAFERPVASLPDSAFILHAYRRWGEDCARHLLGDFAFAIWDGVTHTLICARDHRGVRPLFYSSSDKCIAVASAPRALLALPHVPRRLDEQAVADFLVLIGDETRTFYQNICRVPAGCCLVATPASVTIRRYWSMDPDRRIVYRRNEEYVEAFVELFTDAVRCRLRSAHGLGAFMSGGLDSSSVASVAANELRRTGRGITTFTAVPLAGFAPVETERRIEDETPYVKAIHACNPNMIPVFERAEGLSSLNGLEHFFEFSEAPVLNPSNRLWMERIIIGAQEREIRVLLNGQDGNEWISFSGEPHLYELAKTGRWVKLLREMQAIAGTGGGTFIRLLLRSVFAPCLPDPVWAMYRRIRVGPDPWRRYSAINPAFAAELGIRERFETSPEGRLRHPCRNARKIRVQAANRGVVHLGMDCHSAWRDRFGVELRDPTADKRVVEFCLAIPHDQHLHSGERRALIRRAMRGRLPPVVLTNRKRGIQASDWFWRMSCARGEINNELARLEQSDLARRCLDLARMRGLVEWWPDANTRSASHTRDYLGVLDRGLGLGRFLTWFEQRT